MKKPQSQYNNSPCRICEKERTAHFSNVCKKCRGNKDDRKLALNALYKSFFDEQNYKHPGEDYYASKKG